MLLVHVVQCRPCSLLAALYRILPQTLTPALSPALSSAFSLNPLVLSTDGQNIGKIKITKVALCILMLVVMLHTACGIAVYCYASLYCCILLVALLCVALLYMYNASCTAVLAIAQLHCLLHCFLLLPCTTVQACCPF